jgi:ABC-type phosphate/phosphonate transport system substrate-binding protein
MDWITALPMYNVAPAVARDWQTLLQHVHAQLEPLLDHHGDTLRIVEPDSSLENFWLRDDLLLSQTCGYPLVNALAGRVRLIATPEFDIPGCAGGEYRSVIVANGRVGGSSIEAFRGLRAAINNPDSNSGMNLFRRAVAPFAGSAPFFSGVIETGGHLASLKALQDDAADLAAIDCITLEFVREHRPERLHGIDEIGYTESAPGLPVIASKHVSHDTARAIFAALNATLDAEPELAARLKLRRFIERPLADYDRIVQIETEAIDMGYPALL